MFGEQTGNNSRVRIKICGITNAADALAAIDCGADALGFNFFPGSKRYIDFRTNGAWLAKLPAKIPKVAVLVDPTLSEAIEFAALPFIDSLQLHGGESPEFCKLLAERGIPFAKALPGNDRSENEIPNFHTDTIVLDSFSRGGFGGTGTTFPWAIGRRFIENHPDLKVILAGGLTSGNVADAIKQVGPFAVDVTSGVESSPGRKDPAQLRAFCQAARGN